MNDFFGTYVFVNLYEMLKLTQLRKRPAIKIFTLKISHGLTLIVHHISVDTQTLLETRKKKKK